MVELTRMAKEVILAYAECGMRVCPAARRVYCDHRTVSYHLDKIKAITGYDPRNFYELYKLVEMVNGTAP